jgi:vesicle coat complex subunit
MKLIVEGMSMRGGQGSAYCKTKITDRETGQTVGTVYHQREPRVRHVTLFGEKYRGSFLSNEECKAFVKGVEAVLNHMMDTTIEQTKASKAA